MALYRFNNNGSSEPIEVQMLDAIHSAFRPASSGNEYPIVDTPICEALPLRNIPVGYESDEERIHDGINPCGDPTCYCASYGYGVPSLE